MTALVVLIGVAVVMVGGWLVVAFVREPVVVETSVVFYLLSGGGAITIFPFVFVYPASRERALPHETAHWRQQRRWGIYGSGIGLLAWFLAYVLLFPAVWNPFRRRWETEAFRVDGKTDDEIDAILRGWPYLLLL